MGRENRDSNENGRISSYDPSAKSIF